MIVEPQAKNTRLQSRNHSQGYDLLDPLGISNSGRSADCVTGVYHGFSGALLLSPIIAAQQPPALNLQTDSRLAPVLLNPIIDH